MRLLFNGNLSRQRVYAHGLELASVMGRDRDRGRRVSTWPNEERKLVHTFEDPVLVTDNFQIAGLPPTLRDTLFALFSRPVREVGYLGVEVRTDASHVNVWSPSIDTLLFARALEKLKVGGRALEIGCGSGFIGKYLLERKDVSEVTFVDLNPFAIQAARDNVEDPRARFIVGDGLEVLASQRWDLVVCNPPYIPRPRSINDNPYEGVGILHGLLHGGHEHLRPGGSIVTNASSLAWRLVLAEDPSIAFDDVDRMTVPLKVNNVLNNPSWLRYLVQHGLEVELREGYEYWHTIAILAGRRK